MKSVWARARWREEKYVCAMCILLRISLLSIAWFTFHECLNLSSCCTIPFSQEKWKQSQSLNAGDIHCLTHELNGNHWMEWNISISEYAHSAHSADERTQRNTMQSPIDCVSRCLVILHLLFVDWITNSKLSEYSDSNESMHRLCPTRWTFSKLSQ